MKNEKYRYAKSNSVEQHPIYNFFTTDPPENMNFIEIDWQIQVGRHKRSST